VDGSVVADGDPVAHEDRILVALAVEDGAILNVGAGADADGVDIAAQDGVHPDRGALAEHDVADELGGGVDVTARRNPRRMALIGADHLRKWPPRPV
jgi:hypothetical protein